METTRKVQDRTRTLADLRSEVEALQNAQSAPVATVEEIAAGFSAMSALMGWTPADVKRMAEASHKKLADARERGNAERISDLMDIIALKELSDEDLPEVLKLFTRHARYGEMKAKIPASKGNKVVVTFVWNLSDDSVKDVKTSFPRSSNEDSSVSN